MGPEEAAMKSKWRQLQPFEAERDYLVLASNIPPLRRSSTGRLFRGSRAVAAQLEHADGIVAFAMLARPWRKQYATLSVWADEAALQAFATSAPHTRLMTELAPEMAPTRFLRWSISGADGAPTWADALDRLSQPVSPG